MKIHPAVAKAAHRFNQLSLRERGLVAAATLAAILMIWQIAFMDGLTSRKFGLEAEITQLQETIATTTTDIEIRSGVTQNRADQEKLQELDAALTRINAELASKSAGLIPPDRMVQVIHDVLRHQDGLKLVSLHNQPVMPLMQMSAESVATGASAREAVEANAAVEAPARIEPSGPYVHPVELVVEGPYLEVLRYLQALEALPWRFYWKTLDLQSTGYPVNRVRIELTTLSMDKEWVGV